MPHLNSIIANLPSKIKKRHKKRVKKIRAIEAQGRRDLSAIIKK